MQTRTRPTIKNCITHLKTENEARSYACERIMDGCNKINSIHFDPNAGPVWPWVVDYAPVRPAAI